jgi:DNA polymerase I-like protein with 3'-5' exonuclease and polymerase domains
MDVPYKIIQLSELEDYFQPGARIFADTETCGFYNRVRLLQVYHECLAQVLLIEWPEHYKMCAVLNKYHTVWHNAHYDITTLQQQTQTRWIPTDFDDTFLLGRLAFPEKEKFSLDEIFQYTLGYDPYLRQGLDKKTLQKSKWDTPALTRDQLQYAATDVYYMPQVWERVKEYTEASSYKLDMLTLRYCLDFQWNGMPVDSQRMVAKAEDINARISEIEPPINVNSWQQVRPYIGSDESDDLALASLALEGNTRAANVRETRKLKKQLSFISKFDTVDERIYGKFLPSARSGRLTSKDQNMQQLPRALKDCFGYPEGSDRILIYSDYAQLELRTICAITACLAMEDLFRKGEDLHGYTAAMIFGEDWTKDQRQLSKTYNFNFLYGGGITVLLGILVKQAGVLLDEQQANRDRTRWRNLWREIYAWQERGISAWRKGRLWSTPQRS